MDIILTPWALKTYIDLKSARVFSEAEFRDVIRPKVLLLKNYPKAPEFQNSKFWSVAADRSGQVIASGFKMKWHQIGNGKIQLRLQVVIMGQEAFLCEAYVKHNEKMDFRMANKLKDRIELIRQGQVKVLWRA